MLSIVRTWLMLTRSWNGVQMVSSLTSYIGILGLLQATTDRGGMDTHMVRNLG